MIQSLKEIERLSEFHSCELSLKSSMNHCIGEGQCFPYKFFTTEFVSASVELFLAATCNLTDETLLLCLQLEIFKLRLRAQFQLNIELSVTATAHLKSTSPNWLDGALCVFKFPPRSVFSSRLETGGTAWCLFYDLCGVLPRRNASMNSQLGKNKAL